MLRRLNRLIMEANQPCYEGFVSNAAESNHPCSLALGISDTNMSETLP